jgi:hypothetical protein
MAARPWFLRWGATDEEIGRSWPGDELSPDPVSEATRAITIHAPVEAVWPWLVQIGQDRGGFYSYTWLENLFGASAPHGTWALILDPVDERTTRLIVRSRSGAKEGPVRFLVFDPAHFIMERKMMLGIRRRAEAEVSRRMEPQAA